MGNVKMLGLAVIAALAVVALAGTGTALATKVCVPGTSDGKCAAGERELATNESITATATNATFTTSITNVTCSDSAFTLKMTGSNTVSSISGEVTALSFSGCKTSGGTLCTVNSFWLPYPASLTTSLLSLTDATGVAAVVKCGFLINCELHSQSVWLSVGFGFPGASFVASEENLLASGGLCPENAQFDATYETSATVLL
jgi:hypothetical protein